MPPTRRAQIYIAAVIAVGAVVAIDGAGAWSCAPLTFIAYVSMALFSSTLKVKLPGINGTFSANSLFTLLAIAQLGLAEALCLSVACSFVQSLWRARKPPLLIQVVFNGAVFAISSAATFWTYRLLLGWTEPSPKIIAFMAASCVFFIVNTFAVSGVMGLIANESVLRVWRVWHFWSFPYYLVSAALAALLISSPPGTTVKVAAALIPLVCAVFLCYRMVLERSTEEQHLKDPSEMAGACRSSS